MNRFQFMASILVVPLFAVGCGGGRRANVAESPLFEEPRTAGEYEEVRGMLEERSRMEPDEPFWPYRVAALYASRGITEEAEIRCHDALEIEALYLPALSLLSWIHYSTGRHDEGIALLEEARHSMGELPGELGAALALLYDGSGDGGRAATAADRYDRPGEHWRSAGSALVYVKLRGESFEHAARTARNALGADPGSAANHNNYGITLLYDGDPLGARDSFLSAIDLDPDLPGSYYNIAIVEKFYLFDDDAAAKWFELYRRRSDEDPDAISSMFVTDVGPPAAGSDDKESNR